MAERYFVTGIGTGVGKTVVSALLCEYLRADYFKPIQTGYPPDRDSVFVQNMVSCSICVHPENYLLNRPASPHLAADAEGVCIDISSIAVPSASNTVVIEGAGGLLVPVNERYFIADMIRHLQAECILVVSDYLGCINHSLLSLFYIQQKRIPLKGIILNGYFEPLMKKTITSYLYEVPVIAEIPSITPLNKDSFQQLFQHFKNTIQVPL